MNTRQARVLLTGSSGGIGQAVADALVRGGAAVMLAGRSPARLSAQRRQLQQRAATGDQVEWHETDLQSAASIDQLAKSAANWNCNTIVHCAGVAAFGRLEALDPAQIASVLNTNLLAPMLLTRAMLPHLRSMPRAQVLFVGSALGAIGLPGYSAYSASKFGLRGFAQALRRELGGTTVGIQYLGPRSTRTPFNDEHVAAYNRATGTAMDAPGLVAKALLAQLQDEKPERFLGFPEKLAVRLNGFAPLLLDGAFATHRQSLPAPAFTPTITPKETENAL